MRIIYELPNRKEAMKQMRTKSLKSTLLRFNLAGAKGYPNHKGKKFMEKIDCMTVRVTDVDGLIEFIQKKREEK